MGSGSGFAVPCSMNARPRLRSATAGLSQNGFCARDTRLHGGDGQMPHGAIEHQPKVRVELGRGDRLEADVEGLVVSLRASGDCAALIVAPATSSTYTTSIGPLPSPITAGRPLVISLTPERSQREWLRVRTIDAGRPKNRVAAATRGRDLDQRAFRLELRAAVDGHLGVVDER